MSLVVYSFNDIRTWRTMSSSIPLNHKMLVGSGRR